MIATGGLLRMNRRQDSQRSKNHAENKRRRKLARRRKKNDCVVVKGKLKLISPSGLVAVLGVLVLMVGIAMAVLGYWPHEGHSQGYATRVSPGAERRGNGRMSYSKSPRMSADRSFTKNHHNTLIHNVEDLTKQKSVDVNESSPGPVNGSVTVSTPSLDASGGFVHDFLDRYLYSDNLKVFGPLVMGIGIFLFICANAVLHENRDQKTKVINLRDIYSTVIDLHNKRSKSRSPRNGLVSYIPSRGSVDISPGGMLGHGSQPSSNPSVHQGEQQARRPSMAGRQQNWSRVNQTFTDTVYSIYKDQKRRCSGQAPFPRQCEGTASIVSSSVNAFTLPVIKLNNCEVKDSGGQGGRGHPHGEESDGCSDDEIIKVQDFSENAMGEEGVSGYAPCPATGQSSRRSLLNPVQAHSQGFNTHEKALLRGRDVSGMRLALLTPQEDDSSTTSDPPRDVSGMTLTLLTAQEYKSPFTSKPPRALQEQSLSPLFPASPVSREMIGEGSRLSLNSLSSQGGGDQPQLARRCSLTVAACHQGDRTRRFSCPRLERSNSKAYIKLEVVAGEPFEAPDVAASCVPDSNQEEEKEAETDAQGGDPVTRRCS